MISIIIDSLSDTIKILPWLFGMYCLVELLEYWSTHTIRSLVQKAGKLGPLLGALAGSFPQCGFSVITTALYAQRLVTIGTLIAVYLSTSDEAIPLLLASPSHARMVAPLLITKVVIAIIAGYSIDRVMYQKNKAVFAHLASIKQGTDDQTHHHETIAQEPACCGHSADQSSKKFRVQELVIHPLLHTLKIGLFLCCATLVIGLAIYYMGQEMLEVILLKGSIAQPIIAGIVGLIPNCATSVALTGLYLKGVLSYGSLIAGLCAGGGLGVLVLFREEKNKKEVITIIGLLLSISIIVGIVFEFLW